MKFFLSYESAAPAAFYLTKLEPLFSAKLAALEPKNYGDELTDIGIISGGAPAQPPRAAVIPAKKPLCRYSVANGLCRIRSYQAGDAI